jgi:hypothetical protein
MRKGSYKLSWYDYTNIPAGIYFLDMSMDGLSLERTKVIKLK